jgi:hypothetical protein
LLCGEDLADILKQLSGDVCIRQPHSLDRDERQAESENSVGHAPFQR